jgi:CRISPR-associated endonuclease/helicase Cas3
MTHPYYAHSLEGKPPSEWQPLEEHLRNVANRAQQFAAAFQSGNWGWTAGWLHDVGKYGKDFQDYLRKENGVDASIETAPGRVDHSTAGAQHITRVLPILGDLLAYAVAGHHSGLLNGRDAYACQESRLKKVVHPWEHGLAFLPPFPRLEPPVFLRSSLASKDAHSIAFFVRMVFSCLVDADFLDTEAFINPQQSALRRKWPGNVLQRMSEALSEYVGQLAQEDTLVNQQRGLVREACLRAAGEKPGLFSLSVPTGGGKTLASLAFALHHAEKNGLGRVIYVIPLTSIIEQNAEVFRGALGAVSGKLGGEVVLEHHSNLDPEKETTANRLAAENWDAPLIVTTSVQFYESLFANKTSRCRKLHRLARSVIILDEAQTLPVEYLNPCLRALEELTTHYGSSIVICTATQPAIERREGFKIGIKKPFEIIEDPVGLYRKLQRVRVENIGDQSDEQLRVRICAERQVLCIVNTKLHAKRLVEAIGPGENHFHLSANMCPAHRSEKLRQIRENLAKGAVCRVVSTQVIEAGVDVDFPVVYRSLAGLDSIAQAAGRCNRNGKLLERGRTYIFRSEHLESERFFADTAQCAGQVLCLHEDPLDLKAVEHYFKLYYWDQSHRWDEKRIMENFSIVNDPKFPFNFGFKHVARDFELIDETGYCPVIIPWREEGRRLAEQLRAARFPGFEMHRQLQRFVVQIPRRSWQWHVGKSIELIHDVFPLLVTPRIHYSENTGLDLDAEEPRAIFA